MKATDAQPNGPGSMTCKEVVKRLQKFLDGEVGDELTARRLAEHLDSCRSCGLEAEAFRELKEALRKMGRGVDGATLLRLRRFAARLEEAAGGEVIH